MPARLAAPPGLIKEPDALFGVVDESLKKARGRHVIMLVAQIVRFAHGRDNALRVVAQFRQHVLWVDIGSVIVGQALMSPDVADRSERCATKLAHSLGQ